MDDALRWRLDVVIALLAVGVAMLAALVATANPAALAGAGLLVVVGFALWFVTRPSLP